MSWIFFFAVSLAQAAEPLVKFASASGGLFGNRRTGNVLVSTLDFLGNGFVIRGHATKYIERNSAGLLIAPDELTLTLLHCDAAQSVTR